MGYVAQEEQEGNTMTSTPSRRSSSSDIVTVSGGAADRWSPIAIVRKPSRMMTSNAKKVSAASSSSALHLVGSPSYSWTALSPTPTTHREDDNHHHHHRQQQQQQHQDKDHTTEEHRRSTSSRRTSPSSSSPSSCQGDNNALHQRRGPSVRFNEDPPQIVGQHDHADSFCSHMTEQEMRTARWYSKDEYEQFLLEMDDTIDVLAAGLVGDLERGGYCFRGFEYKTTDIRKTRKSNMRHSHSTVFQIQSRFYRARRRRRRTLRRSRAIVGAGVDETDSSSVCSSSTASSSGTDEDDEGAVPSYDNHHHNMWSHEKEQQEIAHAYGEATFSSREEAHRMGLWDAKTASLLSRGQVDSVPKLPRRTWARAG